MMRLLLASVMLSACAHPSSLHKAEVDVSAMRDGVEVVVDGVVGTVTVPFSTPAPDVPEEDFEDEMEHAVVLRIVSLRSGAAANLTIGDGDPSALSWSLTDERDAAVFVFDPQPPGGLVLEPGQDCRGQFSVADNDYVKSVTPIVLDVSVE
jgi:hypothetical protein